MSVSPQGSFLEQVQQFAERTHHRDVFVPIADQASFLVLVNEVALLASERGGEDLVVLVDSKTVSEVASIGAARDAARNVLVFGDKPKKWPAKKKGVSFYPHKETTDDGDRFLVVLSEQLSLAVAVARPASDSEDEGTRAGGWSGLRPFVRQVAKYLMDSNEVGNGVQLPSDGEAEDSEWGHASNFLLMSAIARFHATKEREFDDARSDLSSVLEILKAISAKRRTHDILYVFVEKIASVVGIDRCSIVRVWGDETKGHVLASHEDASVQDLAIELSKYPEISLCMSSGKKVLVNDIVGDPLVGKFSEALTQAGITAILVIPILMLDPAVGSFVLRATRRGGKFAEREVSFCEIVGEAAANALERAHLFDEIQRANEQLNLLATTDGLTGLFNYRYFRERLDEEFDRATRYGQKLSCLLIDIDDFKKVNDTYGHLVGDVILRDVAMRTLSAVRKSDIVSRYGGEEFVVIMTATDAAGAKIHARRLLKEVSGATYKGLPPDYRITVSIGLTSVNKQHTADYEQLIKHADDALYVAKREGKNRVVEWKPES